MLLKYYIRVWLPVSTCPEPRCQTTGQMFCTAQGFFVEVRYTATLDSLMYSHVMEQPGETALSSLIDMICSPRTTSSIVQPWTASLDSLILSSRHPPRQSAEPSYRQAPGKPLG